MAKKRIETTCPYCGHKNSYLVEICENGWIEPHMHTCDIEDGGCDIPFAVTAKVFVEVAAVKIDWGKDEYPHIDNPHDDEEAA